MKSPSPHCLQALRELAFPSSRTLYQRGVKRCYATNPERQERPPLRPPPSSAIKREPAQSGIRKPDKNDDDEDFIPLPLSRPIGMPNPPQPGENLGLDKRSLSQRRNDFVDYDQHLERRAKMTKQISKPYFRDWSNLRFHKGKIFKSNERLFRADVSLWFPNFYGKTLTKNMPRKEGDGRKDGYRGLGWDTCLAMKDKISIVSIASNTWASDQVDTFCSRAKNPALHEVLEESKDVAQRIWINYENNVLKWWLVQMFRSNLRRGKTTEEQSRYFIVRRGLSEVMKEAIGILNDKAGYVYLVDPDCRIRWAGSAEAEPSERDSMVRGLRRLVQEARTPVDKRVDTRKQLLDAVAQVTGDFKEAAAG